MALASSVKLPKVRERRVKVLHDRNISASAKGLQPIVCAYRHVRDVEGCHRQRMCTLPKDALSGLLMAWWEQLLQTDAECMQLDVLALRTSTPRFLLGTGFPPLSVGVGCR